MSSDPKAYEFDEFKRACKQEKNTRFHDFAFKQAKKDFGIHTARDGFQMLRNEVLDKCTYCDTDEVRDIPGAIGIKYDSYKWDRALFPKRPGYLAFYRKGKIWWIKSFHEDDVIA